jgi:hypothetical protein
VTVFPSQTSQKIDVAIKKESFCYVLYNINLPHHSNRSDGGRAFSGTCCIRPPIAIATAATNNKTASNPLTAT